TGKTHLEDASLAALAVLDGDRAFEHVNQRADDVQAQSGPLLRPLELAAAAIEHLEDLLALTGRNSLAVVANAGNDASPRADPHMHVDGRLRRPVLDCVVDEVAKDHLEHHRSRVD